MTKKTNNIFVEIHKDFWEKFKTKCPRYATEFFNSVVLKMINCGDPQFGYIEYGCTYCGHEGHRIAFSCKSKYCLRCGRVFAEKFVSEISAKLHAGMVYRHLILTIPDQLYSFFYKHKDDADLYNQFYKAAWDFINDVFSLVTKRRLKCGAIIVLHTSGRKGNYRPHLHILVMNGGIDLLTGEWVNIGYFPYEKILPKKWQYYVLKMVKKFGGEAVIKLVDDLWKKYSKGFVNFFMKGDVPKKMKNLVKYLSRYITRPSISLKRILSYDKLKNEVEYEYMSHESNKMEKEKVSVFDFIGRMIQQVLPCGFQKVRYYGLQSTKSYSKNREKILDACDGETPIKSSEVFKAPAQTYADRMMEWTGKNPLVCSKCKNKMEMTKIWIKGKGFVYDLYSNLSHGPPEDVLLKLKTMRTTDSVSFANKAEEEAFTQLSLDLAI